MELTADLTSASHGVHHGAHPYTVEPLDALQVEHDAHAPGLEQLLDVRAQRVGFGAKDEVALKRSTVTPAASRCPIVSRMKGNLLSQS